MTEKLFYRETGAAGFTARVTGCDAVKEGYAVTLDRTLFYPEGGGQPGDTGRLGDAMVLDTREQGEEVAHIADRPLPVGETVQGEIDWARRFSMMQQHTGEHIVSGIVHHLFGLDNVGFHIGRDAVRVDFSGPLTDEQLREVERRANEAVFANLPVRCDYPDSAALAALDYRSKKELTGAVRIVSVPGVDVCACCGLHVSATGSVGPIKIVSSQHYKGGVRILLLCGARAMADYAEKTGSVTAISNLLSAKPGEVAPAVRRICDENAALRQKLSALQNQWMELKAASLPEGERNLCLLEEGLQPDALRRFCLLLTGRCTGVAAVLSEREPGQFQFALGSAARDVRPLCRELTARFSGRGGGSAELAQGTLAGAWKEIEAFIIDLE